MNGGGEPDRLEYHAPRRAEPLPIRDFVAGAASLALGLTSLIALGFRAYVLEDAMVRRYDNPTLAVVHSWWIVGVPTCAPAIAGFFPRDLRVRPQDVNIWNGGRRRAADAAALMILTQVASS